MLNQRRQYTKSPFNTSAPASALFNQVTKEMSQDDSTFQKSNHQSPRVARLLRPSSTSTTGLFPSGNCSLPSYAVPLSSSSKVTNRSSSFIDEQKGSCRSKQTLIDVATARKRNRDRKRIETLFCLASLCCIILFIARYRHQQWIRSVPNAAVLLSFVTSLLLSIVWLIQLVQIYNQPLVRLTLRQKQIAQVEDNEEGFEFTDDPNENQIYGKSSNPDLSKSQSKLFETIDFSKTTSNLYSEDSNQVNSENDFILLVNKKNSTTMSGGNPLSAFSLNTSDDDSLNKTSSRFRSDVDAASSRSQLNISNQSISYSAGVPSPASASRNQKSKNTNFLTRFNISKDRTLLWREHLKKWICNDLLTPIVTEITDTNRKLSPSLTIGVDSIERLKSSSVLSAIDLSKLKRLLNFLDISSNQSYVVGRLSELSKLCMSDYKWSSGGNYQSKSWNELLPTDCDIIFHLFCAYMNTLFPCNALNLDNLYFTKTFTEGIVTSSRSTERNDLRIHKYSSSPSSFRIIFKGEEVEIEKGQYNLLDTIAAFLYIIKVKLDGRLSMVNMSYVCPLLMGTVNT